MERVRDWMTEDVMFVSPGDSACSALERMCRGHVRHVLVQAGEELVGIVSNRDCVRAALQHPERVLDLESATVEQIMTPSPLLAVGPETKLGEAAKLLHDYQVSAVPVLEDGAVVGILTTSDFLRAFFQGVEACL